VANVGERVICVVKDDPFLRLEALCLLEEAGFPVAGFAMAERALAYVERHAEKISLLGIEIRFPSRMSSTGLAREVSRVGRGSALR
jgi:two-component system, response regulator PdtaR